MLFSDYKIFIYITLFIAVYNLSKLLTKSVLSRNVIILIGNVFMLLTLVKEHTLIVLAVLSLLVFIGGKFLQSRTSKTFLFSAVSVVIVLFSIRNYPYLQEGLTDGFLAFLNAPFLSIQKLGLSYILFRFIHFIVESFKGNIQRSNVLTFINYIFFFPSILAGPIDTYNNFSYWLASNRSTYHRSLFLAGVTRIFIGAVKTLGMVPFIINYATDYSTLTSEFSPLLAVFLSLVAYSAYIYLDFSGYSDIAIGSAYLIGIKTPENFNNPYVSQSLSEFWKRWHITFSAFLSLYVFKPVISVFNKVINPEHRLLVTTLSYLMTFLICGLWHGDKVNFIYWGLWHGVGLTLNKLWVVLIKPKLSFGHTMIYRVLSVLITFIYVTIGWAFFHYSQEELIEIYNLL